MPWGRVDSRRPICADWRDTNVQCKSSLIRATRFDVSSRRQSLAWPSAISQPSDYLVVAEFTNDGDQEMRIFLEMTCEEIFVPVGQTIELLARPSEDLLPITVAYLRDRLQVFACREFDPDWHIRFNGVLLKPGYPTRLSELESEIGLPTRK